MTFRNEYIIIKSRDVMDDIKSEQLAVKYGYSERWIREIIKTET